MRRALGDAIALDDVDLRGHERRRVVIATCPEAVICLGAARAGQQEADAERQQERIHRCTSKSKRSTNAPDGAEPS